MPPPIITEGTGYVLFAYDVAHAFDLAAAETRLASATQRQTVKQKRRAPALFEDDPAPLRVTEPADSLAVGGDVTPPHVEFEERDRKSTRLKSSHRYNSYSVFCFKRKKKNSNNTQPQP